METKWMLFSGLLFTLVNSQYVNDKANYVRENMSCIRLNGNRVGDPATNKLTNHETKADASDDVKAAEDLVWSINPLQHFWVMWQCAVSTVFIIFDVFFSFNIWALITIHLTWTILIVNIRANINFMTINCSILQFLNRFADEIRSTIYQISLRIKAISAC